MATRVLFRKVAIIGVGLIGGSLGMAIKAKRLAREVVGFSRRHSTLMQAMKVKAIDKAVHDVQKAVEGADFVILATPVKTIESMLPLISRHLKRGCFITDVGSTKAAIVETSSKVLPSFVSFVGSHPLAGSEKQGVVSADPEMFNNSICILTPTDKTNRTAKEKIKFFWTKVGMTVKFLSPMEHDRYLAYISHLPHLFGYALMGGVPEESFPFITQSLKDTTRIASSSPALWADICMTNSKNIVEALDVVVKQLSSYRKAIVSKDIKNLVESFSNSKSRRDGIS